MACPQCGEAVTAADDEELFELAKAHMKKKHRFLPVTDDKIREVIAANAEDA